ncbi:MAG: hypothetical protein KatS3mg057_0483 [Herpetosiphonaceae bacterium]|nr:MAG: hypothetical protein KatS3mg057_0483 [Herpetosiphonaceae bacterium]
MGEIFGLLGLLAFGIVMIAVGLIVFVAAIRTLRFETLPRFTELRPGPLSAALTLLGSLGPQFVIGGFALAAGLRALQVALRAVGIF